MPTGATKHKAMSGPNKRTRWLGQTFFELGRICRSYRDAWNYIPVAVPGRPKSGGLNPASSSPHCAYPTLQGYRRKLQ